MITAVPLLVPRPFASRHLLPYTCNCLPDVYVQRCPAPPAQSHNCTCVPFDCVAFGTSTHRPDAPPTISCPPPGGGVPPGMAYPAVTMLACTASSVASVGKPAVMAPSKNSPTPLLLLSPPVPNSRELSVFIGE